MGSTESNAAVRSRRMRSEGKAFLLSCLPVLYNTLSSIQSVQLHPNSISNEPLWSYIVISVLAGVRLQAA